VLKIPATPTLFHDEIKAVPDDKYMVSSSPFGWQLVTSTKYFDLDHMVCITPFFARCWLSNSI